MWSLRLFVSVRWVCCASQSQQGRLTGQLSLGAQWQFPWPPALSASRAPPVCVVCALQLWKSLGCCWHVSADWLSGLAMTTAHKLFCHGPTEQAGFGPVGSGACRDHPVRAVCGATRVVLCCGLKPATGCVGYGVSREGLQCKPLTVTSPGPSGKSYKAICSW